MESDLDYWIALDRAKENYIKNKATVICSRCGKTGIKIGNPKFALCNECYREKFLKSLKKGQKKAVEASKAKRKEENGRN